MSAIRLSTKQQLFGDLFMTLFANIFEYKVSMDAHSAQIPLLLSASINMARIWPNRVCKFNSTLPFLSGVLGPAYSKSISKPLIYHLSSKALFSPELSHSRILTLIFWSFRSKIKFVITYFEELFLLLQQLFLKSSIIKSQNLEPTNFST
jgi:hypothetical protein